MKPLTSEWVEKAEGDFATANREIRVRKSPNLDAVCFKTQQCVEKYLKALLQELDLPVGKTHHLVSLLDLVLISYPTWELFRLDLQHLNAFSVSIRYPGETADRSSAWEALKLAKKLRSEARKVLNLQS